ncbi:MAG: Asp-tRNA(Asn)/Glu-tRNA(Gln) amidotransferase subunit GatA [bacterium]|nr:Asp-tRNA(Asn)/Glu-tRNA(Gln) amidotransferase subunit GatA [bacterium]
MKAKDILKQLITKKISVKEVTQKYLENINKKNSILNAFITVFDEDFINEQVEKAQEMINKGNLTPVVGLPIAVKDNINLKGYPTTCASKILSNYVSPYNATVVEKLMYSGAIIVGKTNLDEFAMGSSNENSYYGVVRNPLNLEWVSGGSSGGSAVAVSADMVPLSLGSDTGGSIRLPAAFTGIYGLKPTYGMVSRFGLVAYASSLDQIGPMGKDPQDLALIMQVIAGYDPKDSTSYRDITIDFINENFEPNFELDSLKGLKIGVPFKIINDEGVDKIIRDCLNEFINTLANNEIEIIEIDFPYLSYSIPAYYIIASSEASSNLARYDGIRYGLRIEHFQDKLIEDTRTLMKITRGQGFGLEVKRRIMIGTFCLSSGYYDAYYKKAQQVRTLIKQDFQKIFNKVDLIIMPTSPTLPFKIGEKINDPIKMYLSDIYTVGVNLSGLPSLNIPIKYQDFYIGVQLIGNYFKEKFLLNVANLINLL